ncbi:MAG: hypothetical protein ACRDI3_01080 [Actinomycetota bacterium]
MSTLLLRAQPHARTVIAIFMSALAAAYVGQAVAMGRTTIALLLPAAVLIVATVFRLSLAGWCGLLLLSSVTSRGLVDSLGFPGIINYLHYPIAVAFAIAACFRPHHETRARKPAARWLIGLLLVTLLSAVFNATHVWRIVLFLTIVGEPLLIIWAIVRWGPVEPAERRTLLVLGALLLLQVPIGISQGLSLGWADPVQGTLVGQGAGAHLLGGLFGIGIFVLAAGLVTKRIPAIVGLFGGGIALGMIVAASVMQVLAAIGLGLVVAVILGSRGGTSETGQPRVNSKSLFGIVVVLAMAVAGGMLIRALVPHLDQRIDIVLGLTESKQVRMVTEREGQSFWVGSGPGTSASRASLLLTPAQLQEDSPLRALNVPPTSLALHLAAQALAYGGSAESPASSALGIYGDLGLLGAVFTLIFLVAIWREVGANGSWLALAAQGSLVMVFALSFVDNWLEYPEFTVPLGVLLGLALGGSSYPERRVNALS